MRSQGLKDYASLIRHGGNIELFAAVEMSVASTVGGPTRTRPEVRRPGPGRDDQPELAAKDGTRLEG